VLQAGMLHVKIIKADTFYTEENPSHLSQIFNAKLRNKYHSQEENVAFHGLFVGKDMSYNLNTATFQP
jgi:hypothetical protein